MVSPSVYAVAWDTDFSRTKHLDRWDDQVVEFVFGYHACWNLVEAAESPAGRGLGALRGFEDCSHFLVHDVFQDLEGVPSRSKGPGASGSVACEAGGARISVVKLARCGQNAGRPGQARPSLVAMVAPRRSGLHGTRGSRTFGSDRGDLRREAHPLVALPHPVSVLVVGEGHVMACPAHPEEALDSDVHP